MILKIGDRVRIKMDYPNETTKNVPAGTEGTIIDMLDNGRSSLEDRHHLVNIHWDNERIDAVFQWRLQVKRNG